MDEERIEGEGADQTPDPDAEDSVVTQQPFMPRPADGYQQPEQQPMKRCVCCGAIIPLPALNCSECRSWVSLWEGSIAKEYFYLLVAALTCMFGAMLPWHAMADAVKPGVAAELSGINYMSGAVIFYFSAITAVVCLYNIRSKRLLFWPILLLLVENVFTLSLYFMRYEVTVGEESYGFIGAMQLAWEKGVDFQDSLWNVYRTQGIGLYFVIVGTLFIMVQILMSVLVAAGKDKGKKPAPATARSRRR